MRVNWIVPRFPIGQTGHDPFSHMNFIRRESHMELDLSTWT